MKKSLYYLIIYKKIGLLRDHNIDSYVAEEWIISQHFFKKKESLESQPYHFLDHYFTISHLFNIFKVNTYN